ncbi:uncharacterized protein V1510DRAFT_309168 [Dipodascopsis tothii]|uniref:uncharacterized protein n=1 Tax=Dipodascopsis tothii TaxID=44089 RepID=UPI0034CE452C
MQFKVVLAALALVASASALNSTNSTANTTVSATASATATETAGANFNAVGAGVLGAVVAGGIAMVL